MKKDNHVTAFYVEVLLLTVGLILIVLVLSQVFALGRQQSTSAKELTNAVTLAQNAAEAFSASATPEELIRLLDENGNVSFASDTLVTTVLARYDNNMSPDPDGALIVSVTWENGKDPGGGLIGSTVRVSSAIDGREIYTIRTASYHAEEAAG